jgi:hypothetical protein
MEEQNSAALPAAIILGIDVDAAMEAEADPKAEATTKRGRMTGASAVTLSPRWGIHDPLQNIIVSKEHKEVLRMVYMHRERPRRQAEVTHDVSLDIGRHQLRPSTSDHNNQSALERRNLHSARDDARLRT